MSFPLELTAQINSHNGNFARKFTLNRGLTVLLGPNGSGKTHLLRGLKNSLNQHMGGKHVRFLSAGRMGLLEQYRSDFNGHYGGNPSYDDASFGSKGDAVRRHKMETLNGDFQTLAERADILIKIQERLRKLFKRDVLIDWDGGNLKISFSRLDIEAKPYSSGREASGLMHLVGILAALYDDDLVNSYLNDNLAADKRASTLGFQSSHQMAGAIFADFCKLVDSRWSEISATAEAHPYWVNRKPLARNPWDRVRL